jgi:hypothetical protein
MTFTLISSTTVGAGGTSSVTFSAIPNTFTDLILIASCNFGTAGYAEDNLAVRMNGDSTYGNYGWDFLSGSGNGTFTKGFTNPDTRSGVGLAPGGNLSSNLFGTFWMEIPFYQGSGVKTFIADWAYGNTTTAASQGINTGYWSGTSAVTSLTLLPYFSTTIRQHSIFSLYGRTKGSGGATVS